MDNNEVVAVYTVPMLPEAEAIREALEQQGIHCTVGSETTLTGLEGATLYVRVADADRALKFIEHHHRR
jgi:hypothetical protein